MAGENTTGRPMQDLIDAASDGQLSVKLNNNVYVNAEEFVYIERDCQEMKDRIKEYQRTATNISERDIWGLGEKSDWIKSAPILVGRFRTKAKGSDDGNDVYAILQRHWDIIDSIQELHRKIAERYQQTDSEFASKYTELMASLPPGFQETK